MVCLLQTGIGLAKGILVEGQEYVYASLQNITRGINQTAAALHRHFDFHGYHLKFTEIHG